MVFGVLLNHTKSIMKPDDFYQKQLKKRFLPSLLQRSQQEKKRVKQNKSIDILTNLF